MACTLVPLPLLEGGMMLNVTPWGIESGADPILDWHGEVVVKVRDAEGLAKTGSKNVGIDSDFCADAPVTY